MQARSSIKLVKLRTAAALIQDHVLGLPRASMRGPDYMAALNRAAGAIAQSATILYVNENRELVQLTRSELTGGNFEDGGNLLRAPSGVIYKALCVQRSDAIEAMEAIRRTQDQSFCASDLRSGAAAQQEQQEQDGNRNPERP